MAKVAAIIKDGEDGQITVEIRSDPPFPGPAATKEEQDAMTPAQHVGLEIMEWTMKKLGSDE